MTFDDYFGLAVTLFAACAWFLTLPDNEDDP